MRAERVNIVLLAAGIARMKGADLPVGPGGRSERQIRQGPVIHTLRPFSDADLGFAFGWFAGLRRNACGQQVCAESAIRRTVDGFGL